MSLEVNRINFKMSLTGTLIGDNGARQEIAFVYDKTFSDGSGASQANSFRKVTGGSVAAGTPVSVDMAGWTDAQGATVNPADIKLFIINITAVSAAGATLLISAGASNHLTTMFPDASKGFTARGLGPQVISSPEEGFDVTAGTGDLLLLTATGGTFTYDLYAVCG
jgi:hypothetical protein